MSIAAGFLLFFFNDTATTEIYTLSLHDALPIRSTLLAGSTLPIRVYTEYLGLSWFPEEADRKSTRLNSSHLGISYAVFCLKKKKKKHKEHAQSTKNMNLPASIHQHDWPPQCYRA